MTNDYSEILLSGNNKGHERFKKLRLALYIFITNSVVSGLEIEGITSKAKYNNILSLQ